MSVNKSCSCDHEEFHEKNIYSMVAFKKKNDTLATDQNRGKKNMELTACSFLVPIY